MSAPLLEFPSGPLWGEDAPVCPYCGTRQESGYYASDESKVITDECEKCGKEFAVQTHVEYKHSTVGICIVHELERGAFFESVKCYVCRVCKGEVYQWQLPGGTFPKLKEGEFVFVEGAP